jgi:hypothetical protein
MRAVSAPSPACLVPARRAYPAMAPLPHPFLPSLLARSGKALERLRQATHVLSTVPPEASRGGEQDPVVQAHAQQLCERAADYQWVGYVSSTSGEVGGLGAGRCRACCSSGMRCSPPRLGSGPNPLCTLLSLRARWTA